MRVSAVGDPQGNQLVCDTPAGQRNRSTPGRISEEVGQGYPLGRFVVRAERTNSTAQMRIAAIPTDQRTVLVEQPPYMLAGRLALEAARIGLESLAARGLM